MVFRTPGPIDPTWRTAGVCEVGRGREGWPWGAGEEVPGHHPAGHAFQAEGELVAPWLVGTS